jgi:signal recognition particle subunit SRP68
MSAERAWAYAMQLKFEMNTEPRKKYHMITRLRKAKTHADQLEAICSASNVVDARSKLESQAYARWISGSLAFELNLWSEAMKSLNAAKV